MVQTQPGVRRLAELVSWADQTDPEHPEFGRHNYDGRCPWCRDTVHETAREVLAELARLRHADTAVTILRKLLATERGIDLGSRSSPEPLFTEDELAYLLSLGGDNG